MFCVQEITYIKTVRTLLLAHTACTPRYFLTFRAVFMCNWSIFVDHVASSTRIIDIIRTRERVVVARVLEAVRVSLIRLSFFLLKRVSCQNMRIQCTRMPSFFVQSLSSGLLYSQPVLFIVAGRWRIHSASQYFAYRCLSVIVCA